MSLAYNPSQLPQIPTSRSYTCLEAANRGANFIVIDRKIDSSFEIVLIEGAVYLLTSAVNRVNNKRYNEIYPALQQDLQANFPIQVLEYPRDKHEAILSTEQNYDLMTKLFIIAEQMRNMMKQFNGITIRLPDDAYRIALRNGFSGTEADWLQSLKGRDGRSLDPNLYVLTSIFDQAVASLNQRIDALNVGQIAVVNTWESDALYNKNVLTSIKSTLPFDNGDDVTIYQSKKDSNQGGNPIISPNDWTPINSNRKLKYTAPTTSNSLEIDITDNIRAIIGNYPNVTCWLQNQKFDNIVSRVETAGKLTKLIIQTDGEPYIIILS